MDADTQRLLAFALIALGIIAFVVGAARGTEASLIPFLIGAVALGHGVWIVWSTRRQSGPRNKP